MTTLEQARSVLFSKRRAGAFCPCCDQYAKLYKRKLNTGMAHSLIWLVRHQEKTDQEWVDVPKIAPRHVITSREFGKLEHWALVCRSPSSDPEKKFSGLWRTTKLGADFARDRLEVPSHVFLYNNKVEGFSRGMIAIREAIGQRFDYSELMNQ